MNDGIRKSIGGLLAAIFSVLQTGICVHAAEVMDAMLHEKVLMIPGDRQQPVLLQVTVFMPDGDGAFPLAVLNHGKDYGRPEDEPRYRSAYIARYFLSRGYAVVLPMMRGFAGSQGEFDSHGHDVKGLGLANARDIDAVISFMAKQPQIDASRIVVTGQSFGGWNALAFATLGYPGVRGVINFVGGVSEPEIPDWRFNLINAAGSYGAHTRIPSLWFYGENDSHFDPPLWHKMYEKYTEAGGPATLVDFGAFMEDAHNMLGSIEGFPLWMNRVDSFLLQVGLPARELEPKFLPAQPPAPSHFARIDDANAVPYLDDKGRQTYRHFLSKPFPRVFIIAPRGLGASFDGGYDPLTRGMEQCEEIAPAAQVYAVDDQVVWTKPDPIRLVAQYQTEAPQGNVRAMLLLGRAYALGIGLAKDQAKSVEWIRKAADKGYSPAEADLGSIYQSGIGVQQSYADALDWYKKAAEEHNGAAENNLGYVFLKGLGVTKDPNQAFEWFQRSSGDGCAAAENQLGNMFARGLGRPIDYQAAIWWYQKAADRGFKAAQYSLGYMYEHGWGEPMDTSMAERWYRKAAAQGFQPAAVALAGINSTKLPSLNLQLQAQ